jgi:hypothetical protein
MVFRIDIVDVFIWLSFCCECMRMTTYLQLITKYNPNGMHRVVIV